MTDRTIADNAETPIKHESGDTSGEFQLFANEVRVGELAWTRLDDSTVEFNHTWVSDTMRGAGIAGKLLTAAVEWARREGVTVMPSCGYVVRKFDNSTDYADIDARSAA